MAKWVDQGENRTADILFGAQAVDATLYMGLYTSPTSEPGETAVINDLTEPSTGGYARQTLTRGSWNVVGSAASYAQQTFAPSGASWGNVYGYFICTVVSGTAGKLMGVEQFIDGPYSVGDGDTVKVAPTMTVA